MGSNSLLWAVVCATAAVAIVQMPPAQAQGRRGSPGLVPKDLVELRAQDARVDRMLRRGELRVRASQPDKLVRGRRIERTDQYLGGVRVFGADVARQLAGGQTVSVFGTIYDDLLVDTTPSVSEPAARRRVEEAAGVRIGLSRAGELVVLPRENDAAALSWRIRAASGEDLREYFVDAHSGAIVFEYSDLQTQSAVGRATGVLGDAKKVSVVRTGATYRLEDALRPPRIRTYDMKGDPFRTTDVINGIALLTQSDVGADSDNNWEDGPLNDTHAYSGFTYDYYFKRFNRRGLNDANLRMESLAHPVRRSDYALHNARFPEFFANAVYYGNGLMVYGVGLPTGVTTSGRNWNYASGAIDIVAHEITHGVTDYTSDLIYRNESGALNESFSDIMGTAVEFFFQPPGDGLMRADYLCAEDIARGSNVGIRSLASPIERGHPDHYSIRYTGTDDGGGVHGDAAVTANSYRNSKCNQFARLGPEQILLLPRCTEADISPHRLRAEASDLTGPGSQLLAIFIPIEHHKILFDYYSSPYIFILFLS